MAPSNLLLCLYSLIAQMPFTGLTFRSSHQRCFCKKWCKMVKNATNFRGKHLNKKRPQYRCFPVKFEKFLKTPILNTYANNCSWTLHVDQAVPWWLSLHHFFVFWSPRISNWPLLTPIYHKTAHLCWLTKVINANLKPLLKNLHLLLCLRLLLHNHRTKNEVFH